MQTHLNHCTFLAEHGSVIVSIQSPLTDDELVALCDYTARLLADEKPHGAVLDLTGLDVADSYSMQNLRRLCTLFHLYAVNIVIAGIRPEVAVIMALRGLGLKDEIHVADLTDALARLEQERKLHILARGAQRRTRVNGLGRRPRG